MTDSLRIHVINNYFFPVTAGIETAILRTFALLAQRGHEITIHTSQNTLSTYNVLPATDQVEGLTVKRYHWTPHLGFFPQINVNDCDVIVLENFDIFPHVFIFMWVLWLKVSGKKQFVFLVAPHGSFTPLWKMFSLLTRFIRIVYYHTLGVLLMNLTADAIQVLSDWEKDKVIHYGVKAQLLHVIPNGIEAEAFAHEHQVSPEFRDHVAQLDKYIIQLARIDPVKNIESVVKALPYVSEDVKFVVAGPVSSYKYKKRLDDMVERLKLKDRVIFWGTVTGAEKFYLLTHALLMVHMSLVETLPISVLEGMSQGLVCIVSLCGMLPLLVRDHQNGFCVSATAAKEVGRQIVSVVSNQHSEEIERIKSYNRASMQSRAWNQIANEMENTITRAC